ncbi:UNVERIFIED_CONTAM: hypothetical protein RMT77_008770 [Armadillidium vulgare]
MVKNLSRESHPREVHSKYYVHPDRIFTFLDKNIEDFVSKKSLNLSELLGMNTEFLMDNPSSWNSNSSYVTAKKALHALKTANDTVKELSN